MDFERGGSKRREKWEEVYVSFIKAASSGTTPELRVMLGIGEGGVFSGGGVLSCF